MTYQGRSTPQNPLPATETQMSYIRDMIRNNELPDEPRTDHPEDSAMLENVMDVLGGKVVWGHEASPLIDWLKVLPLRPGAKPNPRRTRQNYPARQQWTGMGNAPVASRSHKDVALELVAVARQLAAQPGVKERMRLVGKINSLEAELLK